MAIVGLISVLVLRNVGTNEALSQARDITRLVGNGIVEPNITPGVMRGNPRALARFDRLVRRRVLQSPIVRVKLWRASGRLIYSDARQLIGQRYPLAPDDLAALHGGKVQSNVSDLSKPENRYERGQGKLLQVYLGITGPGGVPLLFEAYQKYSSVTSSGQDLWLAFAPALIAALVVLELVQLPLASSMARRIRRGNQEREALLERAVDSSQQERRRIAADLHDGVVQDLAGVSFSLAAAAERAGPEGSDALRRGAAQTRESVGDLRRLMVEIYPPRLQEAGLEAALADLLAPLQRLGVDTSLDVDPELQLAPEQEAFLFRTGQEALRNVAKHAEARRVEVGVERVNGATELRVADDGRGFAGDGAGEEGHFGLALMQDLAEQAGGEVEVDSSPGRGTTVRARVAGS